MMLEQFQLSTSQNMLQTCVQVMGLLKNLRYNFDISILHKIESNNLRFTHRLCIDLKRQVETIFASAENIAFLLTRQFAVAVTQFIKLVSILKIKLCS